MYTRIHTHTHKHTQVTNKTVATEVLALYQINVYTKTEFEKICTGHSQKPSVHLEELCPLYMLNTMLRKTIAEAWHKSPGRAL